MTKNNNFIRKLSAGLMASLCAVSMLATPMTGMISASAASSATENEAFPSADEVIAQAATLLGSPYGWGFKGYTGVYYQGSYSPLSLDYVRQQALTAPVLSTIPLLISATAQADSAGTILFLWILLIGCRSTITAPLPITVLLPKSM